MTRQLRLWMRSNFDVSPGRGEAILREDLMEHVTKFIISIIFNVLGHFEMSAIGALFATAESMNIHYIVDGYNY